MTLKRQVVMLEVTYDPERPESNWGPLERPDKWDWEALVGEGPVRVIGCSRLVDVEEED